MKKVNIADLVAVPELKSYYTPQPIEGLLNSIQSEGQKTKVVVSPQMEIIDGYRIVDALKQLGIETVEIEVVETYDLLKERIVKNSYRIKTEEDQVEEVRTVLRSTPKSQGKKQEGISRAQKIVQTLGHKWQDEDTINKVEFIMDNDFENKILSKAVVMKNQSVESCYEFLKNKKSIDQEKNYGYTKMVEEGTLSAKDASKFVNQRLDLEIDQTTFIIPDKCHSYNTSCIEIEKLEEFHNKVQLVFTSVYYWQQRFYEVGEIPQPGHEETKEEYLDDLTKLFIPVCKTLTESAVVAINISDSFINGIPQRIPYLFIDYMEKNTPLKFIGEIIWSKKNPRSNGGSEDKIRPKNKIEYVMTFALNPDKVKYKKLKYKKGEAKPSISNGYKDVDKNGKVAPKRKSLSTGYKSIKNHIQEQEIENIITTSCGENHDVSRIIKDGHPAIMSPMLPITIIQMFTDEETDWVYDPMAGSNVVGRSAQLLNRRSLSTELSSKYFKVGCRMLQNAVQDFNREDLDTINELAYPDYQKTNKIHNTMVTTTPQDNQEFVYPGVISSEIKKDAGLLTPEEIANTYWPEEIDIKENSVVIPKIEIGEGSFIFNGNNMDVLKSLPDNSVDSCVTDPPYGISLMKKKWDYDVPTVEFWEEVLRVLKPGGHVLSFSSARTYHRMTTRIEDAGFEIRDQIMWIYGSGMPKSHNVALSIDKSLGFPNRGHRIAVASRYHTDGTFEPNGESLPSYEPKSEEAKHWKDWGTGLKPAHEPIVVARKPLSEKTYAKNILKWGTGGLNINKCRIAFEETKNAATNPLYRQENNYKMTDKGAKNNGVVSFTSSKNEISSLGRHPANIIFDEEAAMILDEQSGKKIGGHWPKSKTTGFGEFGGGTNVYFGVGPKDKSKGGASRFFYKAKTSKKERSEGLLSSNTHPTVKPTELMQYLVRLVTPQNGITIDPFFGSGSTAKGCIRERFRFIGIEQSKEYFDIAVARCEYEYSKQNPIEKNTYSLN